MSSKLRILHIGIHESLNRNAGDTYLFEATRHLVERVAEHPIEWSLRQVWEPLDVDEARTLGNRFDAVVLGGGGLLLRDQAGADSSLSGWQWACSPEATAAISAPLFVIAIGYNRFRGHPDFDAPFAASMRAIARTAALFSVRNQGSQRSVRSYLPDDLRKNVSVVNCPTTMAAQLYPDERQDVLEGPVALNFALDRVGNRFGPEPEVGLDRLLGAVAGSVRGMGDVRLVAHKSLDLAVSARLSQAGLAHEVVDVSGATGREVRSAYSDVRAVIGMRGHGQLIPFGLLKPILTLVSHDKMAWFLEDIGHPEWGIEVTADDLNDILPLKVAALLEPDVPQTVARIQRRLWLDGVSQLRRSILRVGLVSDVKPDLGI